MKKHYIFRFNPDEIKIIDQVIKSHPEIKDRTKFYEQAAKHYLKYVRTEDFKKSLKPEK